jgi:hypothetical protein
MEQRQAVARCAASRPRKKISFAFCALARRNLRRPAVPCTILYYSTVLYSTVLYYCTVQYSTVPPSSTRRIGSFLRARGSLARKVREHAHERTSTRKTKDERRKAKHEIRNTGRRPPSPVALALVAATLCYR